MEYVNKSADEGNRTYTLDITSLICPMTFVRTKLTLEGLNIGDILEVTLKGEEPLSNVPRSVKQHGHSVLSIDPADGDAHVVTIRKEAT